MISGKKIRKSHLSRTFFIPNSAPANFGKPPRRKSNATKGTILLMHRLVGIHYEDGLIRSITAATPDGHVDIPCDYVLSSMPVKDLVSTFTGITVPPKSFRSDLFALPGFHHSRHPRGPPQNPTQRTAAHLRKPHTGHLDLYPRTRHAYRTGKGFSTTGHLIW